MQVYETVGIDTSDMLDELLRKEIESKELVGASLFVSKQGKTYYKNQVGYADRENRVEIKEDTIFRLYSMTKPVTAVAAMILVEQGKLDLYDPVCKYLPGFNNQKVHTNDGCIPAHRNVTIQDLLSMSAGIVYPDVAHEPGSQMEQLFAEVQAKNAQGGWISTVEFCNRMGEQPLLFQPGFAWNYGACADVLGAVIEVASGMRFGEFIKQKIFKPLHMEDTDFFVPEEKQDRFAQLYIYAEEERDNVVCTWRHLALTHCLKQPAFESGGAGLVSTIKDYAAFAHMLAMEGEYEGTRILSKESVRLLRQSQLPRTVIEQAQWESNRGCGYGNFLRVVEDEVATGCLAKRGEFGWDGWTGSYFFVEPSSQIVGILMIQRCGYPVATLMRKIKNVVYGPLCGE